MDTKVAGLVGAVVALAPLAAAHAAPVMPNAELKANSFADLLAPIPNATETLRASDALLTERAANSAKVEMAQYYHHHHHHHRFYHHHHHHHFYHHHHHRFFRHHHHHHHFYRY